MPGIVKGTTDITKYNLEQGRGGHKTQETLSREEIRLICNK